MEKGYLEGRKGRTGDRRESDGKGREKKRNILNNSNPDLFTPLSFLQADVNP